MAQDVITIEAADAALTTLSAQLDGCTDIHVVDGIRRQADAIQHLLRVGKFGRDWQNRFAALRFRAMRATGDLLNKHLGHGRPASSLRSEERNAESVDGDDTFPTLDELGLSRDYSADCQRMARIKDDIFERYLSGGDEKSDVLNKSRLLDWCGWETYRVDEKPQRDAEKAEAERQTHDATIREAASAATASPPAEETPPEPPPTIEIPEPPAALRERQDRRETVVSLLRTAVDTNANPHEAKAALSRVAKLDPRLDSLEVGVGGAISGTETYIRSLQAEIKRIGQKETDAYRLQEELRKLKARDGKRLEVIKRLKAENEALRAQVAELEEYAEEALVWRYSINQDEYSIEWLNSYLNPPESVNDEQTFRDHLKRHMAETNETAIEILTALREDETKPEDANAQRNLADNMAEIARAGFRVVEN